MRVLLLLCVSFVGCTTVSANRPRALVTLPPTTWAKGTQILWYDIQGDSDTELRAQMDAKGPELDGDRHDAYTSWHVTWKFPFVKNDEGCTTGPVTTDVRVVVTLPRWLGYADVNDPLVRRWIRYLDALQEHESGHRLTGINAASDITEQLPQLPPKPTCPEAEETANALARKILEGHRARDVEYDAETKHGATQGATFP